MANPVPFLRGNSWCADLRLIGGSQRHALGVSDGVSLVDVGVALERKVCELRLGAKVSQPGLFDLSDPALRIADLVLSYREAYDQQTDGGASYVRDCCKRVTEGLGHMTVADLCAPHGSAVLKKWRDNLWAKDWKAKSVRNVLNFAKAVLVWGQSDGRALTGPVPILPKFCRKKGDLSRVIYDTMTETDFRYLRDHAFDEALRTGGINSEFPDKAKRDDYIARRKLYLSGAFYMGAHDEDLNTCKGEYLNVFAGRYLRCNTKSAGHVVPEWFDMPEQFRLDCESELKRRDLPCFPKGDLPFGGLWLSPTRVTVAATKRFWPDGSRVPFTFRLARRSCVWEYTVRGWRTHEISMLLGHVDETMVRNVYRHCSELGLVSQVRMAWTLKSGPHGGPSRLATVTPAFLSAVK